MRHWSFYYITTFFRFYFLSMKNSIEYSPSLNNDRKKEKFCTFYTRKRQNNPFSLLPFPWSESYIKRQCGHGDASRSLERSSPGGTQPRRPSRLFQPQPSPFSLRFFSVELIRSMRAPGRAARHAGTVSICEPTQTGSPGARPLCIHTSADFCTHAHSR